MALVNVTQRIGGMGSGQQGTRTVAAWPPLPLLLLLPDRLADADRDRDADADREDEACEDGPALDDDPGPADPLEACEGACEDRERAEKDRDADADAEEEEEERDTGPAEDRPTLESDSE